ncbi:hypothetical protein EKK58_12040 [Candidatus Dependentiae bacterium]|nr:MAG: hypothetical protein EKK58_12040 [Candidatus Dependentiae bacterium]
MNKEITLTNNYSLQSYASDLQAKLQFCKYLLSSALCPKHFKSESDVLTCILFGQEIGITPMQALQTLYIVNGIPTLPSAGIKALVITAGGRFKTIEWTAETCKLTLQRGDWIEEFEYTIKDAQRAGLTNKEVWQKHPKQMLYARASTVLGRNMFADVLKGLQAKEELEDNGTVEGDIVPSVPMAPEPKFQTFTYDTRRIKDEQSMMAAQKFCEVNNFESLGNGVYRSIIDSKKLASCKIGDQNATV